MNCPICVSPSKRIFPKNGYWIREFTSCYHRFTESSLSLEHVGQVYGDEYFSGKNAEYPNYLDEAGILIAHGKKYANLISQYTRPGKMLDVGCAAGFILKGFVQSGWQGTGIEPNARMANYARNCLGLHIELGTLEAYRNTQEFDLITLIQVLPHLYDLRKGLSIASEITTRGGFWLVESWDKDSFVARITGKNWHEYNPPSVLHWFSIEALERILQQYGLEPVARGRPLKWFSFAHAKTICRRKINDSYVGRILAWMLEVIPENLVLPYPGDDLFWALFQKK
jgi:SAM-dependent methyltransferase